MSVAGCRRALPELDGGPPDSGADAGPGRMYLECNLADGCPGAEVCFPIGGASRQALWCSIRCSDDADCPSGICVRDSGTIDDGPRCHQTCETDADCSDPTFGCHRATITSSRGSWEGTLCFPE